MWNESVTLYKEAIEYIDDVDEVKKETKTENVPANFKSVRSSEFYLSNANNIKADLVIEMMSANYNGERNITDERTGIQYEFVRSFYTRNNDRVELVVSAVPAKQEA